MEPRVISIESLEDAIAKLPQVVESFKEEGVVVLRGFRFGEGDHARIAEEFAAYRGLTVGMTYEGGHSDSSDKHYELSTEEYALHWHIEKPYYVHPIEAGIWNMYHFTGTPGTGQTLFVDSSAYYDRLPEAQQEFLDKCITEWDKRVESHPDGAGPFLTRAVGTSPITGKKTIRVEVDPGCILTPELYSFDGREPSPEQKVNFKRIVATLGYDLYEDKSIRISHPWQEGDLLFVDLFTMYHAVSAGFTHGQRKFTGVTLRGESFYRALQQSTERADAIYNSLEALSASEQPVRDE
jgi:alpha-ketoglutarate-dependent taurine dioxygenase